MMSKLTSVAALSLALIIGLNAPSQAGGFTTTGNPTRNNSNNNRTGSTGAMTFVGTIDSINLSNRTIVVSGADSVVASRYLVQNANNNRNVVQNNKPVRTLEKVGETETKTFELSGFCRIELEGRDQGKMGAGMTTIKDLTEGQRISIDYTKGVGGRFTAKHITTIAALKIDKETEKPAAKKK